MVVRTSCISEYPEGYRVLFFWKPEKVARRIQGLLWDRKVTIYLEEEYMENTDVVVSAAKDTVRLSANESTFTAFTKMYDTEIKDLVLERTEFNAMLVGAQNGGIKIGKRVAYRNVALGSAVVLLAAPTVALWVVERFQKKNDR